MSTGTGRIVGIEYRLDGLCPDCYLPALWAFPVYILDGDFLVLVHTWEACADCWHRDRIEPEGTP